MVPVAVKFPTVRGDGGISQPPEAIISKQAKRRNREIDAGRSVTHPNILPPLGTCDNPDPRYKELFGIVLPYCAKGNACTYLAVCPRSDRLHILCGVGAALFALHSAAKPVVHGDIKASNILISDGEQALLSDFGLSRVCDLRGFTTSTVHGTWRWMAVELIRAAFEGGELRTSTASDVWAFAMTILEVLTGQQPFAEVKSHLPVIFSVYNEGARPRRPDNSRVTDAIWTLLESCWGEQPKARPDARHVGLVLDIIHKRPNSIDSSVVLAILRGQWDTNFLSIGRARPSSALPYKCKWAGCPESFGSMDECIEHECKEFEQRRAPGVQVPQRIARAGPFTTLRSVFASFFCC